MAYNYVAETGVIVPDTATLQADIIAEWQTAFGNINTTPSTPQGVMITGETIAREAVVNNNAMVANQINPNIAQGVFLDAICALMGIERRAESPSIVRNVTLSGIAGTAVPAGLLAEDTNGNTWELTSPQVLPATAAEFRCTTPGPIALGVGELIVLNSQVLGLETVYNSQAATPGDTEELNSQLRNRRRVTLARQGISTDEAQLSGVFDIPGVTSAVFRENTGSAPATIDGVLIDGRSIWLCVDGGEDATVAAALQQNKTVGAGYTGAVEVPVTNAYSGQTVTVKFDRPEIINVSVTVTGRTNGDKSVNPHAVIPTAIADWAAGKVNGDPGLTIGTPVSVFEVGGAINIAFPGFSVTNITLSANGVPVSGNVPVTLKQRAVIMANNVTVSAL